MFIRLLEGLVKEMDKQESKQAMRESQRVMRKLESSLPGGANYMGGYGVRTEGKPPYGSSGSSLF